MGGGWEGGPSEICHNCIDEKLWLKWGGRDKQVMRGLMWDEGGLMTLLKDII